MFAKTVIVLVLLAGTASTVLAAPKAYSSNPANDVFDIRGRYLGSDPDPNVRAMLQRDLGD